MLINGFLNGTNVSTRHLIQDSYQIVKSWNELTFVFKQQKATLEWKEEIFSRELASCFVLQKPQKLWFITYESSNDFRWSVKLNGHLGCPAFSYKIGIASKFTGPMYSYGRYEVNTENAITLRLDLILKVSHNAIEIEIRCLTLSFNEPSKLYLVLSFYHKGIFRCALERKGGCLFIEPISLADEDEIHFRFQSKLKKLCISLVCSNKLTSQW